MDRCSRGETKGIILNVGCLAYPSLTMVVEANDYMSLSYLSDRSLQHGHLSKHPNRLR